jgi:hypothetical protein
MAARAQLFIEACRRRELFMACFLYRIGYSRPRTSLERPRIASLNFR